MLLFTNIDQTLPNILNGQTHCKIGDTCVYHGHVFCSLFVVTHLLHNSIVRVMNSRVSGQCSYTIHTVLVYMLFKLFRHNAKLKRKQKTKTKTSQTLFFLEMLPFLNHAVQRLRKALFGNT